jgi:hypothetical protein
MKNVQPLVDQMQTLILAWAEANDGGSLEIALAILFILERFPMAGSIVEQRIEDLLLRNQNALINGGEIYSWGDPKHGTGNF